MTDKERFDWLEIIASAGACPGLVHDDNGHWAVSITGMQNVPEGEKPSDISTSFFVEASEWRPSARDAVDAAFLLYPAGYVPETEK